MKQALEHDEVPADLADAFRREEPGGVAQSPGQRTSSSGQPLGLDALHTALEAEGPLDRVASLSTRVRWALAGALSFGLIGVVLATSARADLVVYPRWRMGFDLLLLMVPLAAALWVSLRPLSRPALAASWRWTALAVGVVGVAVLVGSPVAHTIHPASMEGTGDAFLSRALGCFAFGLVFAALATLGMGLLSRNGVSRISRCVPGALGVWAAGLMGSAALYFHCPITHPEHMWAGHATVVLPMLVLVWAVRRRLDG